MNEEVLMTHEAFRELYTQCVTAMRDYVVEVKKSCVQLGQCTAEPLSDAERLSLVSQEVAEKEAYNTYLSTKRRLCDAALLGKSPQITPKS
jgi:hypothetical protein